MADEIDILHVAKLARIALSAEEVQRFGAQLADLLGHVKQLAELPLEDVSATAQVIEARNAMRDDTPVPSLERSVVLAQAPSVEGFYLRVPRIIAREP